MQQQHLKPALHSVSESPTGAAGAAIQTPSELPCNSDSSNFPCPTEQLATLHDMLTRGGWLQRLQQNPAALDLVLQPIMQILGDAAATVAGAPLHTARAAVVEECVQVLQVWLIFTSLGFCTLSGFKLGDLMRCS